MHDDNNEVEKTADRIAIIGISPRNGFFSQENITALIGKTLAEYPRAVVMIADVPATANWVALGYDEEKAWRKARLDGNNCRNRVRRACQSGNFNSDRISIPIWESDIEPRIEYQDTYKKICKLYETNQAFKAAAQETTGHFLENAQKGWNNGTHAHAIKDMGKAVDIAVHYLLAELSYIETSKGDYIYIHEFPIYDDYRRGKFDGTPRPQLGMKVFV